MDYIAHYEKSPRMWSQGLHAHDDYEIYLHLNGGRFYCIDDTVFKLTPNQLLIIPMSNKPVKRCHHFLRDILRYLHAVSRVDVYALQVADHYVYQAANIA